MCIDNIVVNTNLIILKLSYEIHKLNGEFILIKRLLWTILLVSNLRLEFIFGSFELVGAKSLALYSGVCGQPVLHINF